MKGHLPGAFRPVVLDLSVSPLRKDTNKGSIQRSECKSNSGEAVSCWIGMHQTEQVMWKSRILYSFKYTEQMSKPCDQVWLYLFYSTGQSMLNLPWTNHRSFEEVRGRTRTTTCCTWLIQTCTQAHTETHVHKPEAASGIQLAFIALNQQTVDHSWCKYK